MIGTATAFDWVFRHAGDCLIEFPDLRLPPPPPRCALRAWVATQWRDPASGGWVSAGWAPAERGWQIPRHLAAGDVLEFGLAAINPCDGLAPRGWDLRWYGWLRYATELALVVAGPYSDAQACGDASATAVAEIRLAQLTGPDVDPSWQPVVSADVDTEP